MTEAKTAAIMDAGVVSRVSGRIATGTGTDCQAIVCPEWGVAEEYAGKHTRVGSLIGRASYEVIRLGIIAWNESTAERMAMKKASVSPSTVSENLYTQTLSSEKVLPHE